jgi:hypothetical protein
MEPEIARKNIRLGLALLALALILFAGSILIAVFYDIAS